MLKVQPTKGKEMTELYYCVKCKEKTEMKDAQRTTMKNGKPALKGRCAVCGTTMNALLATGKNIKEELKQAHDLLKHLRACINHDTSIFPSIDNPFDEERIREGLLKRVAEITGEDE